MGLQALVPRKRTTISAPGHHIYPYLLRNLLIERPDQVWCTEAAERLRLATLPNTLLLRTPIDLLLRRAFLLG